MKKLIEKWDQLAQDAWDCGYDSVIKYLHYDEIKYFRRNAKRYLNKSEGEDKKALIRIIEHTA